MRSEFWLIARTVACLALAVISLGAAPIYHRVYQGQARLIPQTATCFVSITLDELGAVIDHSENGDWCGSIGSFLYDESPILDLPAGSAVVSAELRQWGSFNIKLLDSAYSVEPVDPAKPFRGESFGGSTFLVVEGWGWDPFEVEGHDNSLSFDVLVTDYFKRFFGVDRCVVAVTFSGPPDCPPEIGMPLLLNISEVDSLFRLNVHPEYPPGMNSITTMTSTWGAVDSAAFYSLDIAYEAPVPEPATPPLFVVGAAGFLLLGRVRRTRQL